MASALITGIQGFLGEALSRHMALAGYEIHGSTTSVTEGRIVHCDITVPEDVEALVAGAAPDVIVHCAAISSVTHRSALDYYATNVLGVKNMLAAAIKLKKRGRFIFISTAGVYGNQPFEYLHEGLAPLPVHDYGMSKFCAERWVGVYADQLDTTIIRPFNVVGPKQNSSFIVPKLAKAFAAGEKTIRLGNIDVYRDYVDVGLSCEIMTDLIESKAAIGETVNLCTGHGISLRDLIAVMDKLAGYSIEVVQAPEFIRKEEVWRLLGSNDKLLSLLGKPLRVVPLEKMLKPMLDYYKQQGIVP
jgi:GDP-6-deoxy-D-talose 4-dehydrogenase